MDDGGCRLLPKTCQMVLFSATYNEDVMKFASMVIPDPIIMRLKRNEESLDNIKQVGWRREGGLEGGRELLKVCSFLCSSSLHVPMKRLSLRPYVISTASSLLGRPWSSARSALRSCLVISANPSLVMSCADPQECRLAGW